jgi:hypothetical protein
MLISAVTESNDYFESRRGVGYPANRGLTIHDPEAGRSARSARRTRHRHAAVCALWRTP